MTSNSRAPRDRIRAGWGWLGAFVTLIVLVWSVDRSSRRLPLEPVETPPSPANLAKATRQSASAPEAPQSAPGELSPQKSGIVLGTSETSREFSRDRTDGGAAQDVNKLDFNTLGHRFSSNFVDSMKSLLDSRPAAGSQANGQAFVLLSSSDEPSQRFASLEAAIAAASDDDVIELDFDGFRDEIVRPIRTARRITIRAAPRRRPQLEIGLNRDEAMSGSVASPKIFNVAGGALSIADVDLVLNLPAGSSGRWSIFALTQGGRVSLRGASITVQNRDRLPVAVIDAASGGARAIARAVTEAMAERPLEVSLESCLVRGGADLVWQDGADVVDIRVAQSALALNGALFRQTAGPPTDAMTTGRGPNELLLEHVTAVLERPLVSIELGDRESTRPLQFDCRNSVIKVTDAIQPLISVIGQGDVNDYLDALTWNGRHNWFDLAGPAVEISTPGVAGPLLTTLRIDEWLSRWSARGASEAEQRASGELFANGEAWRQGDFTRIDPDDFTLNGSSSNPVLRGADDGGAAGVDLEQRTFPKAMPALPAPRSAERSSRRRYAEDPGLERIETPETRR